LLARQEAYRHEAIIFAIGLMAGVDITDEMFKRLQLEASSVS
jgi:hypothetical protein